MSKSFSRHSGSAAAPSRPGAQRTRREQIWGLIGLVAVCLGTAAIGGAITSSSVGTWYQTLQRPAWTPPDWVFAPVWTALYVSMAMAGWLVWRTGEDVRLPLVLFGIQLLLNLGWSVLFFGLRSPGAAAVEIVWLWAAIVATTVVFVRRVRLAGWLFVPYAVWVTFAAALNVAIWRMN